MGGVKGNVDLVKGNVDLLLLGWPSFTCVRIIFLKFVMEPTWFE